MAIDRDPLHSPLVRRLPLAFIEYPMEVLLGAWATLSGLSLVLGVADPQSVSMTMPPVLQLLWAGALLTAGLTIVIGLALHHYGTSVARGLSLLGWASLVYAVVLWKYAGWERSVPAAPLVFIIALLCWLRAWWLGQREEILRHIARGKGDFDKRMRERGFDA